MDTTSQVPSYEEICRRVHEVIAEALCCHVSPEEIKMTSRLQGDLGAESIDFLDIVYRLEREFHKKIPRGDLFPESIFYGHPEFVENGKVTDQGLQELRARMPCADLTTFAENPEFSEIRDLYTVEMVCKYMQGKLAA